MSEKWVNIKEFPNYQVSNLGRIRNTKENRYDINIKKVVSKDHIHILKQAPNRKGYLMVNLRNNNKNKLVSVHRLVAKTFIPNVENKEQVNHINGIKTDNRVENLEWCSVLENIRHSWEHGLRDTEKIKQSRIDFINVYSKMGRGKATKEIKQYDKNGNLIKTWSSVKDAAKCCNINYNNISCVALGKRKSAGGYVWKYSTTSH